MNVRSKFTYLLTFKMCSRFIYNLSIYNSETAWTLNQRLNKYHKLTSSAVCERTSKNQSFQQCSKFITGWRKIEDDTHILEIQDPCFNHHTHDKKLIQYKIMTLFCMILLFFAMMIDN